VGQTRNERPNRGQPFGRLGSLRGARQFYLLRVEVVLEISLRDSELGSELLEIQLATIDVGFDRELGVEHQQPL
jgi:hypothetical protein